MSGDDVDGGFDGEMGFDVDGVARANARVGGSALLKAAEIGEAGCSYPARSMH